MAAQRVSSFETFRLTALILVSICAASLLAQVPDQPLSLTLEQASSRTGKDFVPAYEGRLVKVAGQVSDKAFHSIELLLLGLRDDEDFGLFIEGRPDQISAFEAGDTIEVTGHLARRRGMPVLVAVAIRKTGRSEPAGVRQMNVTDAAGMRNLALSIEVEGRVTAVADSGAAEILTISDGQTSAQIVLYKRRRDDDLKWSYVRPGDRIRASGLLVQDAALPPYDRFFAIAVRNAEHMILLEGGGMIPAYLLLSAAAGIGLVTLIWWIRDQRTRGLRSTMKTLNGVGEEILAATSLSEMLKKLDTVVPLAARVSGISVYLYNRKSKRLELVRAGARSADKNAVSLDLDKPANAVQAGVALCFRNRAVLSIPDTRRSELFKSDQGSDTPRSLLYLPMLFPFTAEELLRRRRG